MEKSMVDSIITKDQLIEAGKNADAWEKYWAGSDDENVITRLNKEYPTHAKALKILMENGGLQPFETEVQLLATVPVVSPTAAKALDTKKVWLWKDGTWIDTGSSEKELANQYTREVASFPENFTNSASYKENGKIKVSTSNGTFYQKVSVRAGERFLVKSIDYNVSKAWYLVDANDNVIDECKGFPELASEIITIKNGGVFLYANCINSEISNFKLEKLSTYEQKTLDLSGDYPLEVGIAYISDNASRATAIRVGSPAVTSMIIRTAVGDKFKIDARKIGSVKTQYFVAEDFTIVRSESENEPDLKFVTVPEYAAKLIVCSNNSYNFSVLKANYFDVLAYEASIKPDPVVKKNLKDFYPQQPNYRHLLKKKCPKFYNKLRNKTDDLTVCMTGTSLAQGNLYTTSRSDATTRPPLLHTSGYQSCVLATGLFQHLP